MLSEFRRYKITYTIIAINLILYLLTALLSANIMEPDLQKLVDVGALYGPYVVLNGEWWRVLSAMFLHGSMTHILMNMFSLYLIGRGAEIYFDTKSYLTLYFFSGVVGGLVSLYMHMLSVGVGASGAIFGLFGALAGFFLAHRDKIEEHTKSFMKNFGVILVINVILGLSIESVDMSAHIGGLLVGLLGGYLISKDKKWYFAYTLLMVVVLLLFYNYLPIFYIKILF